MGDVMESFKMKVPVPSKITIKDILDSPQGQPSQPTATSLSEEFKTNFVNDDGSIKEDEANPAGYFGFYLTEFTDEILDLKGSITLPGRSSQYKERTNGGDISTLKVYKEEDGKMWFYILDAKELWNLKYHTDSKIGENATRQITEEDKIIPQTFTQALESLTKEKNLNKLETQNLIETQVEKLQGSKIHYLLYQIQKIAEETIISSYKDKLRFAKSNVEGGVTIDMGKILNKKEELKL